MSRLEKGQKKNYREEEEGIGLFLDPPGGVPKLTWATRKSGDFTIKKIISAPKKVLNTPNTEPPGGEPPTHLPLRGGAKMKNKPGREPPQMTLHPEPEKTFLRALNGRSK